MHKKMPIERVPSRPMGIYTDGERRKNRDGIKSRLT